jgi:hypothetical protein
VRHGILNIIPFGQPLLLVIIPESGGSGCTAAVDLSSGLAIARLFHLCSFRTGKPFLSRKGLKIGKSD